MTCIVGVVDGNRIIMGGDSAGVAGIDLSPRKDVKVFHVGEFLIGYTSSFRMGQLLRYKLQPPPFLEKTVELHQYMATDFVDAVRTCLRDGGFASKENEVESAGHFLVGIRGRLFTIQSDYQVGESLDEFDSCGCGYQIARGSLFSTSSMPAKDRVRVALEAAERYSAGVRSPFIIEESV